MANFALECPHCGTMNKASTFIFSKKEIVCGNCKSEINVKANRMAVGNCQNCGSVAFDRAKGVCPICKSKIAMTDYAKAASVEDLKKSGTTPLFVCPECGCDIQASKQGGELLCPVCSYKFDGYEEVFSQIQKSKLVTDNGISIIKYEGDNQTFVWKHPIEDFNMGSKLIVHESQEAIFFLNGQALDLFGPGEHMLETENIPVLKKVYDLPTGKQKPFHAELYFINKTVQMGIKWGTDSRVHFVEPRTNVPLEIGACGEMNVQVFDSRKLLIKLVGTTNGISWDTDSKNFTQSLRNSFKPLIITTVKANLASVIKAENISILEIDEKLEMLSEVLRIKVSAGFEEYGLNVPQFYVTNIALPENDKNINKIRDLLGAAYFGVKEAEVEAGIIKARRQKVLEEQETEIERAKFEAEKKRIAALADAEAAKITESVRIDMMRKEGLTEAEIMQNKGYTEKDVIAADVQKAYAAGIGGMGGSSGGGVMSDIVSLGVGMAAVGVIGGQFDDAMKGFGSSMSNEKQGKNQQDDTTWKCLCGCDDNRGRFCSGCGMPKPELWECPNCGEKDNKGKFCSGCGMPKPQRWECSHCGAKGNTGKFCSECGKPKEAQSTWDCECGNKGITGKFCSECGKRKEG